MNIRIKIIYIDIYYHIQFKKLNTTRIMNLNIFSWTRTRNNSCIYNFISEEKKMKN